MIVIYSQDKTVISDNADEVKSELITLYGKKIGMEAYEVIVNAPYGTSFQKYGGPLVQVVDDEKAEWIRKKEREIGRVQLSNK